MLKISRTKRVPSKKNVSQGKRKEANMDDNRGKKENISKKIKFEQHL